MQLYYSKKTIKENIKAVQLVHTYKLQMIGERCAFKKIYI